MRRYQLAAVLIVRFVQLLSAGLFGSLYVQIAVAQTFPIKPIRIIVPWAVGGVYDVSARMFGQQISNSINQQIIVENRPGGSTIIGMRACAQAAPDGYTLCLTNGDSLSLNPHLFTNLSYDPDKDFVPIIHLLRAYSLLLANARVPFNSIKELIALAKMKPGVVNWGTWGAGSTPDIYLQWLKHQTGIDITAVPYKGAGQAAPALLTGEVDITLTGIGAMLPHIRAGKLKAIVVTGNQRSPVLADVPSLAEEGVDPGLRSWMGVFAPAGTSKSIIDRLNAEFSKALQTTHAQEFLRVQTLTAVGGSAAEFADFLKKDRANAGRVFKALGVRPSDAPL